MAIYSQILEFIDSNFSEAMGLSAILKGKSMNKEELMTSIIDMEHCEGQHAENILTDALKSGFVVLNNNKYSLYKDVKQ